MVNEDQFQRRILDYCAFKQLKVYHVARSDIGRVTSSGFPDLVIVGDRIIFVELKSDKGRLSAAQAGWANAISAAGGDHYLWRPSDWDTAQETINRLGRAQDLKEASNA